MKDYSKILNHLRKDKKIYNCSPKEATILLLINTSSRQSHRVSCLSVCQVVVTFFLWLILLSISIPLIFQVTSITITSFPSLTADTNTISQAMHTWVWVIKNQNLTEPMPLWQPVPIFEKRVLKQRWNQSTRTRSILLAHSSVFVKRNPGFVGSI